MKEQENQVVNKKIYFASDCHLGIPDHESSLVREKIFVDWLDQVRADAGEIYLLGDIFDSWFEYKRVVPKGYVRLLGKLAEITDSGIPVSYFIGNHDMWMYSYFQEELNIPLYSHPVVRIYNGRKFYIGHGDGLGPRDRGYKLLKAVMANKACQWLFARLHPNFGIGLANFVSRQSRKAHWKYEEFLGEDNEWLIVYAKQMLRQEHFDYFIFGHRHLALDIPLAGGSRYINLGDWISNFSYAEFDGKELYLKKFIQNGQNLTISSTSREE